jgi:hypothetical protein
LGDDVRAVSVELMSMENREPLRGSEAAEIWSRVFPAVAGQEPWVLDFFSHLERLREFCRAHQIKYREERGTGMVILAPEPEALVALYSHFERETFGARAGQALETRDIDLEKDLRHRGLDAYHHAYPRYLFCAVCDLESGSLTLLTNQLWASEVIRRVRPAVAGLSVEVQIPS